ncbi:MAG: lysine--tRNA ligase [Planctomycetes bacterium]|nr:lysine--tRNA ligase [Planctomycetota bacterium]MBL7146268.1 lysine--tRNA ligase [Phycisphaerae bacterium]
MKQEEVSNEANKFEKQRQEKLSSIKEFGIDPYGGRYEGAEPAEDIKLRFKDGDDSQQAKCAGRIVLLRDIGKLIFITLRDRSGTIQVGLSKKLLAEQWSLAKLLEHGDIIGASGQLGRTKTGEITIWVDDVVFLSKCLLQPPEKFHGLADIDQRYRQRYVDLWANPEVMERFKSRSAIIYTIRELLKSKGFLEVETPMMQTIAGGAAAKPFITHHNSLDMDLFLRISPELFLKRLLVGGMEKVFEVNRNFRNEGLSRQHNPEFTMLEVYQAYGDYNVMMDLTEEIFGLCVEKYCESEQVQFGDMTIDFTRPWRRATYSELLKEYSGCDIDDIKAVRAKAKQLGLEVDVDDAVVVNEVFETTVEDNLVTPTFVIDYPAVLCPLAKRRKDNPQFSERFELFIARMELANAYTELNDPAEQYENFRTQLRGQEESLTKMDMDYITALKYGMPPAGGLGIGIDRLVMVLTGVASIRDVVLFPLLRPAKG